MVSLRETGGGQQPAPKESLSLKSFNLNKLRQQIAERANSENTQKEIPLSNEKLKEAWQQYTLILKENKNPAEQSFKMAELKILSDGHFEVITNNNLEQKFIEQEKRVLSEHLQKFFCNRLLHFSIRISENPIEFAPIEKTLSKKDQFVLMAEQYPLIRELKDKLKLELDY